MTLGEFRELTQEYGDDSSLLIFPNAFAGIDEDGNEGVQEPGVGVYDGEMLIYIGDAEVIQILDTKTN